MTRKKLAIDFKIKSIDESGEFSGYASVFGVKDSYSDIVMPGAFSKSLAKWGEKRQLPALLWQHKTDEPIGIFTSMKEDDHGLYVEGRLLKDDDELAKRAYAHLKAGSIQAMSIGYSLNDYEYDKDKGAFQLKEIDLWEVSLVTFPANEEARIDTVKASLDGGDLPQPALVEQYLRDAGFSRKQAKTILAGGYKALRDADSEDVDQIKSAINSISI
ncbi:MAG: HK97 family phage prohead protease [Oleispira sp.]|nr:HK97 family phage prohead protease [Oleispira sp.]